MRGRNIRGMIVVLASVTACASNGGRTTNPEGQSFNDEGDRHEETAGQGAMTKLEIVPDISKRLAQFAPVAIDVDDELITEDLRPVLQKLVLAADVIDELYLGQISADNAELRNSLASSPRYAHALAYFDIMYGPWDRLSEGVPFVGRTKRAPGGTFYPEGLTREGFQSYIDSHPDQRDALTNYFTVIRQGGGDLVAVPYSEAYREQLEEAARLLREAAALSSDERLNRLLNTRADAFLSNDYRESDEAWLQLGDCPIELVIGPYEVYEDELMGMKAAFEAFITLRDPEASQQLERVSALSLDLERALPIEERHRNLERGDTRPISVVYVVMTAGDTRAGVQTLAFNLPNDEQTREEHGYKLVLLRNVMEAKFNMILTPIANRLVHPEQLEHLSFAAFLNNTLMHESAHGLGPGTIQDAQGNETNVNRELREHYSTIEEAKADIVGLFSSQYMIDNNELPPELERQIYATFLAGFFRSVRFGATEAHGRANMIQFNYLMERRAIERGPDGRYRVDYDRIKEGVRSLAHDLLTLEAEGNYEGAGEFIERYGSVTDELRQSLGQLGDIPVDIWPNYPAADSLRP